MHSRPTCLRLLHVALLLLAFSAALFGSAARANWLFSYPPNQVKLDSGKRNNVFLVGDPVQFSLDIFNYGTYNSPGTVRYEVRDYWGNIAASGTVAAPIPNGPTMLSLPTITQPGWYKLYLHQATPVAPWGDSIGGTMFVVFRPNANFPVEPSENLLANSGGSDGGDEVARGVLGMGPERHSVTDASQPAAAIATLAPAIAQDKQYYTPYDPQRPRPLLIAFPNGVGTSSATQQAANLAGLTQIVQQFHNDVKYWEPLNEPQSAYSPTDYINKELIPFYQTVKAVDPTCKVLGPAIVTIGPGGSGLSWIQGFLQAGGAKYIDGFSFHAYNNVNGDLTLARESLDGLQSLLTQYGVGNIEKWQTEQGYFAACYGAYQPRLQGRWTMLQMMVYEQYGIPKEHNHLWYDKSHGFWDFPAFWENEDGLNSYGSFDPAAPLMRVWSEELYGTNFQSAYNLGALGNKLYVGSLFGGPGKQVAAFQSGGRTDGSLTLNVTGGSSIHVVSAFGVASDLPVTAGQAVLPVPELPVYVELAAGQTIQPVPVDYGTDLALTPGTVATTSGTGVSPLGPAYADDPSKIINGTLENWYYNQGNGDRPWMGNDASFPAWVQVTLPQPMAISHAVVYAGVPWQSDGSLLDYEFQYDQNGQWVTLAHPTEPTNVVDFFTSTVFCTADSFYSDRDVFVHDFAPVTTQKVRLLVHNVTYGGGPTQDIVTAGGQTGPQQITLREIELYGPSGQSVTPIKGGPITIGFLGDSITYGIGDGGGPGCYDWTLTDLAKNGYQPTGVNCGSNGASVASFYQQTAGPLQAFEAAGVSVVSIMLGTNDAQISIATSPQAYHDKLLWIINSLLAPGTGIQKVILHYSPYIQANHAATWDSTADAQLQAFQTQIDSLCNGTTILQGDKLAFSYFQQYPEQGDGVHPNPQGHQDLGDLWAIAITNALGGTNTLPYPTGTATPTPPTSPTPPVSPTPAAGPKPYSGTAVSVGSSATAKVEAENYDLGGEGIAYHDIVNNGDTAYRADNIGVEAASTSNGYLVTWTAAGEWEGYTLNVASAGTYTLTAAVSSPSAGGTFHIEFGPIGQVGGAGVTKSAEFTVPSTGSYTSFQPVTLTGISLPAGPVWMRVVVDSQYPCKFDYFTLSAAAAPAPPVPVLTSIAVSPGTSALSTGGTQQFVAVAYDQNGAALSPQPSLTWSVAGVGTVSAGGLYSAGTAAGVATVQAASGSVSGKATVTVTAPLVLTSIVVSPGTSALSTGGTQQFVAVAYDQNGAALSPQPSLTWSVAGVGTVSAGGLYSAGTSAGSATVQASSGSVSGKATITVTAPVPPPVVPTPAAGPKPYSGTAVSVGSSATAKVEAENYDLGGEGIAYHDIVNNGDTAYRADNIGVEAASTSNGYLVTWTANGEWEGYTLNVASAGTYTLTAAVSSPSAGGTFHIEFGPIGQVGGAGVTKSAEFTVPSTGSYTSFQPVTLTGISLPAGPVWMRVVVDSQYPCKFDYFTLSAAAAPAPPVPVLTSIAVSPGTSALSTGGTQQFVAVAYDQNGAALSPQPSLTWSVAGVGTVSAGGLYSAGASAGSATVQASSGSVSGKATVTVTAPAPPPVVTGLGSISFYPRVGSANRMQGGQFQGSTDGVNYTTLYTISGVPADSQWTSVPLTADPKTYRYLRYLSPNGGWGNVSEVIFYSGTGSAAVKLTGTPFGSPGSYNNDGNDFTKVYDGDITTFFDGPSANGNFAGIDQGGAPVLTPVYQISAGGPGAGTFTADKYVQGGSTDSVGASATIDVSAANAAPQAVYQSERWGTFTYTLPNLTPGASYTLRLHFAEIYFGPGMLGGGGAGSRVFNVAVNGASVLANFDIFATVGSANKALVKTFPATADASGNVTVSFTNGNANAPKLSGLELLH